MSIIEWSEARDSKWDVLNDMMQDWLLPVKHKIYILACTFTYNDTSALMQLY